MRTAAEVCLAAAALAAAATLATPVAAGGDLAAAVEAAFRTCDAGPLAAHLPGGRPVLLDAPGAGVPRAAYSGGQARNALERILDRLCGGEFEIVAGRDQGVLLGRWSAPAGAGRGPQSLQVSISRTGSLVREIKVGP